LISGTPYATASPVTTCTFLFYGAPPPRSPHSFPTRRSSDLHLAEHDVSDAAVVVLDPRTGEVLAMVGGVDFFDDQQPAAQINMRSEEHTSELQSLRHLVCRLLLEKKKKPPATPHSSTKPPAT